MTPTNIRIAATLDSGYSGSPREGRYSGFPAVSVSAAVSAGSRVSNPALSMTWSRSRTVIERDAFATLRILTATEMDFGSISFDIVRSGRATGGVRIMRLGHARSVRTSSPALPAGDLRTAAAASRRPGMPHE
jgi:hypothetical protein